MLSLHLPVQGNIFKALSDALHHADSSNGILYNFARDYQSQWQIGSYYTLLITFGQNQYPNSRAYVLAHV